MSDPSKHKPYDSNTNKGKTQSMQARGELNALLLLFQVVKKLSYRKAERVQRYTSAHPRHQRPLGGERRADKSVDAQCPYYPCRLCLLAFLRRLHVVI
jgi:hypothetical protein